MVKIIKFDLRKSVNENAAVHFEKAKKLKRKIEGVEKTVEKYRAQLIAAQNEQALEAEKYDRISEMQNRKTDWYEKFRWFFTSKGHLCIGGRDATSNETVIKKHTAEGDLVFHTDMAGSPFFVIKADENPFLPEELEEAATVTACYSRAWKVGHSSTDVFYVKPEQVTKEANSGEFLSKGSFVIRGQTNYISNAMRLAISVDERQRVIVGSEKTIPEGQSYALITQGDEKTSDVAKKLRHFFGMGLLDDYVKVIPAGGSRVSKLFKGTLPEKVEEGDSED